MDVNVISHKRQRYAVWFGGSLLASTPEFSGYCHSKVCLSYLSTMLVLILRAGGLPVRRFMRFVTLLTDVPSSYREYGPSLVRRFAVYALSSLAHYISNSSADSVKHETGKRGERGNWINLDDPLDRTKRRYVYTAVHMENVTAAEKDRLLTIPCDLC